LETPIALPTPVPLPHRQWPMEMARIASEREVAVLVPRLVDRVIMHLAVLLVCLGPGMAAHLVFPALASLLQVRVLRMVSCPLLRVLMLHMDERVFPNAQLAIL